MMDKNIEKLEKKIKEYKDKYYKGNPEITDQEYDNLELELKALKPDSIVLKQVGSERSPTSPWVKAKHCTIIGSLDKTDKEGELISWINSTIKEYPILAMLKYDGLSVEAQYKKGILTKAITRGDGITGETVTENVLNIPSGQCLDKDFTGILRGEIIMRNNMFREKYAKDYTNARNLASGIVRRKGSTSCCDLDIFYYDMLELAGKTYTGARSDILDIVNMMFINTVDYRLLYSDDEVIAFIEEKRVFRQNLPFNIDGLVFRDNTVGDENRKRPAYAKAFKFDAPTATTIIRDIEWTNTGKAISPVAIIDPTFLEDTTVSRVSIHNVEWIKEKGIYIGATVTIKKGGDIIPCITEVTNPIDNNTFDFIPTVCPLCDSAVEMRNQHLVCTNTECPAVNYRLIKKLFKVLGINFAGPILLAQIADKWAWADLIEVINNDWQLNLFERTIAGFKRMGPSSAKKVKIELEHNRNITTLQAIWMLDIDNFSSSRIQYVIDAGFDTTASISCITKDDLVAIPGFQESLADSIISQLEDKRIMLNIIISNFNIEAKKDKTTTKVDNNLYQFSFVLTGTLSQTRSVVSDKIKALGGIVHKRLTGDTTYLIAGEGPYGSKHRKADKLGVIKITEEEAYKILKR